jgi:hypothetical protein
MTFCNSDFVLLFDYLSPVRRVSGPFRLDSAQLGSLLLLLLLGTDKATLAFFLP